MTRLLLFLFSAVIGLRVALAAPLPSPDLSLAVIPRETIFEPGPFRTCQNTIGKEAASAYGPGLYFPRVLIDWRDPVNELMVTNIRVSVRGSGIARGQQTVIIPYSEVSLLFGGGVIPPDRFVDSAKSEVPKPRSFDRKIAPCGLAIQGLVLDSAFPTPFTAEVEIQFYGVAVSADYSIQLAVMTTMLASAEYIP